MDVDTGTTAFMLCCIIGLTLMIPGLALFYGGMVSVKSSTNMMMMTFGACADRRRAVGAVRLLDDVRHVHTAVSSAASPNSPE